MFGASKWHMLLLLDNILICKNKNEIWEVVKTTGQPRTIGHIYPNGHT
jgi:hypothetical protein